MILNSANHIALVAPLKSLLLLIIPKILFLFYIINYYL